MKLIPIIFMLLLLVSCTSSNDFTKGKEILEQQGFTNIVNTGYNMFCCSHEDRFSTGFSATDKNGNNVKGCFCSDVFKGITVRYE